jgi:hypothetical protein
MSVYSGFQKVVMINDTYAHVQNTDMADYWKGRFFLFSFNLRIKMTWKVTCLEEAKKGKIVIYKYWHNLKHSSVELLKMATSKTD